MLNARSALVGDHMLCAVLDVALNIGKAAVAISECPSNSATACIMPQEKVR